MTVLRPPGGRRQARRWLVGGRDDFVVVLFLLTASYVLFAITSAAWARGVVSALYVMTMVVAVRAADPTRAQRRAVVWIVLAGAGATGLALLVLPVADAMGLSDVALTVLLAVTLALVLGRVLAHRTVTVQTIAGALSAYLLIGMTFTSVYAVVAWLEVEPFFASGAPQDVPDLQYFSFATLTTLGYGDLTAASGAGRGLATFEALVGQIFLATLVASLVASFRESRELRELRGQNSDGDAPPGL
ncbi:Ion channel [Sanguibacter gelidistatuariae]|uniref:Ion channel n=1 Tax=Sanguibacter gelidistatuariae TaxID=1814289 RepID=A0A1G6JY69_9MICO|nr:potassium channel family protein [Sanguibacter gelidistatuariae]SDC23664.1 Ion channel [Sanguibacter gelidistatuariae]